MVRQAHKVVTTDADIDAALARAKNFAVHDRRVTRATYDEPEDRVTLALADGIIVSIPRRYLQGLHEASPAQLSQIEIVGKGTGLRWPQLDVAHYVTGLLNQVFGTRQWMAQLGRVGGKSKSPAKARAARANGQLGGRPAAKSSSAKPKKKPKIA